MRKAVARAVETAEMEAVALRAGRTIKARLMEGERAIDQGLIAQSMVTATLLQARIDLGLQAQAERDLIAESGAMLNEMFAQRTRMLAMHSQFSRLARDMGLTVTGFGDAGESEDLAPAGRLTVVAAA